jgi:peptidoglycan/LPS O-acetylase OafA/YrhL
LSPRAIAFNYYIAVSLRKPMITVASLLSIASGFALMGYHEPPTNLIATSIIVDLALAPLTAIIAARRGRSPIRWTIAGLALGAWALAAVMVIPPPAPPPPDAPDYPPTSRAA